MSDNIMELEIKGQRYEFKFGLGFAKEVNGLYQRTDAGMTEDVGLQALIAGVISGNVIALTQVLDYGNKHKKPRLTPMLLEEYFDDPDTDIDAIFEEVGDFFERSNAISKTYKAMKSALETLG